MGSLKYFKYGVLFGGRLYDANEHQSGWLYLHLILYIYANKCFRWTMFIKFRVKQHKYICIRIYMTEHRDHHTYDKLEIFHRFQNVLPTVYCDKMMHTETEVLYECSYVNYLRSEFNYSFSRCRRNLLLKQ